MLGLVRVVLGVFLFYEALRAGHELVTEGYFGDAFHMAFLPESLVPSRAVYTVLLAIELVLAALVVSGHRARLALVAGAGVGLHLLLCNRLQFHHNRYSLLLFAFLLSLSPCDRAFVVTGGPKAVGTRTGPLWAMRLAQAQLSIIYLASALSKLFDDDWRGGLVIGDRFLRHAHEALAKGIPAPVVDFMCQPGVTSALAKAAIVTELALALGLWWKRTRVVLLWWGVWFHLTIEVTSQVEIFSWLSLTIYALFATPDVKARKVYFDPVRVKGKILGRIIMLLDWLARFDVRPWEPDGLKKGHSLVVVRRDGTRATGVRALAMVARCTPLLFPLWAPLALVASFTKQGDLSAHV